MRGVVPVSLKRRMDFHHLAPGVGEISQSVNYLGQLTLQKGQYLQIPSGIRDKLDLKAGDSLAIELEGNTIVLKPVAEPSADRSVKHNIIVFPCVGKSREPLIKVPVHKTPDENEINKVG